MSAVERGDNVVVVLALGSNLGDRLAHLAGAVAALRAGVTIVAASSVYASDPVGYLDQPEFLNAVVTGHTTLRPEELLALAHRVEADAGRRRSFRDAPRTLDVDLVFYGAEVIRSPDLVVPHPRWRERAFVTEPLLEIAPATVDPLSGRPVGEVVAAPHRPLRRVAGPDALLGAGMPERGPREGRGSS